ncbi:MAG TPA: DegQ family serine endoprotease [Candidatus Manganitrophaceae bacterium]|nr:DegQ family serine endoprotease [Candidatus Manganitrophaceae bacterium]
MNDFLKAFFSFSLAVVYLAAGSGRPTGHAAEPPQENRSAADPSRYAPIFVEIAKKTTPAVVNISTTGIRKREDHASSDSFSNDLFKKSFGGEPSDRGGPPRENRVSGLGSGVIVDPNGYVVTNSHVIADAREIRVILKDRREFPARVVGSDTKSDIAVIKIEADHLPSVLWGDSSKLQVGEYALAIGNSFGLTETVTLGIISAVGRANIGISDYEDFIQTDAPINPGNSGGALMNIRGELIGVNTAIFSQTGGSLGIGFAIPSNMARPVMESLIKTGRVVRGWLGLSIQEVTPDLAREFGLPKPEGVLIGDLLPGSPAAKAGLHRGDVILEVDGKAVESTGQLRNLVASTSIGGALKLIILREGKPRNLTATVEEPPREAQEEKPPAEREAPVSKSALEVVDLTPEIQQELGLPRGQKGAVVNRVPPGSNAEEAGLRRGDLIVEVNRKPVASAKDSEEAMSRVKKDQPTLLLVSRGGRTLFLAVRLADR